MGKKVKYNVISHLNHHNKGRGGNCLQKLAEMGMGLRKRSFKDNLLPGSLDPNPRSTPILG